MDNMDIREILSRLPHRYPFVLIDRVVEINENAIVAVKNVSINEPFFIGHFPTNPIMPGVLMLEALAQAGCLLAIEKMKEVSSDALYLFAGVDNARFKHVVVPGDQLRLHVEVLKHKGDFWKLKGEATVDGKLACSAELLSVRQEGAA